MKFAIFYREILINPQISAVYRWISLINIVKSLDFLVKSLVFAILLTVLAFFCSSETKCIVGLRWREEKLFHSCIYFAYSWQFILRQSSINPLRNPQISLIFSWISINPWLSVKSVIFNLKSSIFIYVFQIVSSLLSSLWQMHFVSSGNLDLPAYITLPVFVSYSPFRFA